MISRTSWSCSGLNIARASLSVSAETPMLPILGPMLAASPAFRMRSPAGHTAVQTGTWSSRMPGNPHRHRQRGAVHPAAWTRRRLALPGGPELELPTLARGALDREGFEVIERRQPSLLAG